MQEPHDLGDPALRDRAVRAARGIEPFDLLLRGGVIVDVATGETYPADVGLVGPLIASVHPPGALLGARRTLDIPDRFIAPGLIDTHMHVESSMLVPRSYAEIVVPQGTTTICWDPHELGNVLGLAGVEWAIAASRGLPLRVLVMAPSCVPSAPGLEVAGAEFGSDEMAEMLRWPEVIGVAEVMDMRGVIERSPRMRSIVGAGLASGKLVCGHARGMAGTDLQAFAAAGIESDHEVTSGPDLIAKLRAGFAVELRGSHDYVLPEAVAALAGLKALPPTLTICTDDVFPDDLVDRGGMVDVLRRLIRYGMPAIDALRAATLHAALRLQRRDLGLVAAGRRADLVVFGDLQTLPVELVIAAGERVAAGGRLEVDLRPDPVPPPTGTVKLPHLPDTAFTIRRPGPDGTPVQLRTIRGARFAEWSEIAGRIEAGAVALPDEAGVMAVVHRHGRAPADVKLAVLEDWGRFQGAIATTVAHDSHNLNVFGRQSADMAAAANAVTAQGGGMAVARQGAPIARLPLPVCGLLSTQAPATVAREFRGVREAADSVAEWKPPYRVFKAIVGASLACNAGPHLTDRGLTDGTSQAVVADGS